LTNGFQNDDKTILDNTCSSKQKFQKVQLAKAVHQPQTAVLMRSQAFPKGVANSRQQSSHGSSDVWIGIFNIKTSAARGIYIVRFF
jgi:hypothetical protein